MVIGPGYFERAYGPFFVSTARIRHLGSKKGSFLGPQSRDFGFLTPKVTFFGVGDPKITHFGPLLTGIGGYGIYMPTFAVQFVSVFITI